MKIAVIGGGPGGLYFAYLIKKFNKHYQVTVYEQNPKGATFGFGVVFSDRALEFLREDDAESYHYLAPHMQSWPDLKIVHRDRHIPIDGNGFAAVGRLEFLELLQARCVEAGVDILFEHQVAGPEDLSGADLIVAADGVNSQCRNKLAARFGTREEQLDNRFVWYGTAKPFDCLTLTFRDNADGAFCAHHYRYSPKMSTFIVECDAPTWQRAGFAGMDDAQTRAYCETVFAPDLEGQPLISNKSVWRRFPQIHNAQWSADNVVLLGDSLHTAHFSIGSGTRLAMEDAIALFRALKTSPEDLGAAFARYEETRRPPVEKLVDAATVSARWYEGMAEAMKLPPYEFAHHYMTRTGRVSDERLTRIAPNFMAGYAAHRRAVAAGEKDPG